MAIRNKKRDQEGTKCSRNPGLMGFKSLDKRSHLYWMSLSL